jgi:hypothetical protein
MNFTSLVSFNIFSLWLPISHQSSILDLSAGIYIPVSLNSSLNFTISYFDFNCPSVTQYLTKDLWTSFLRSYFIYSNSSALVRQAQIGSGFFVDTNYTYAQQTNLDDAQFIIFGSFYNSNITLWTCQIYTVSRNINLFHQDAFQHPDGGVSFLQSIDPADVTTATPFTDYNLAASFFSAMACNGCCNFRCFFNYRTVSSRRIE